jgi:hypothetical protein
MHVYMYACVGAHKLAARYLYLYFHSGIPHSCTHRAQTRLPRNLLRLLHDLRCIWTYMLHEAYNYTVATIIPTVSMCVRITDETYRADHGVICGHVSVRVLDEEGHDQSRGCCEPDQDDPSHFLRKHCTAFEKRALAIV